MRLFSIGCLGIVLFSYSALAQVFIAGPTNTVWRYWADNTAPSESWTAPDFDDSSWASGRGFFGNDSAAGYPGPMTTLILGASQGGPLTAYYRTHFTWQGATAAVQLIGTNYVDDGCILYLNGMEISRFNMPAGPVNNSTVALAANPGGYPNLNRGEPVLVFTSITLDALTNGNPNPLRAGDNVLAVEVHQNAASSSDHVFGLLLATAGDIFLACVDDSPLTNRTVKTCEAVTFRVAIADQCGVFLPQCQWYFESADGGPAVPIFGATRPTYVLNEASSQDRGRYYCVVQNLQGIRTTRRAELQVLPNPTPLAIQYAYIAADNQFRVAFNHPVEMLGGENDPSTWRVFPRFPPGPDLTVLAAYRTNGTEVALVVGPDPLPGAIYSFETLLEILDRCGDSVLPPGRSRDFETLVPVLDYTEGHSWAYNDTGDDPGPDWMQRTFDDWGWKYGPPVFDVELSQPGRTSVAGIPVGTRLALTNYNVVPPGRIPTYLFRCHLHVWSPLSWVLADVLHDDGLVVYVNGREVFRHGMTDDRFDAFGGFAGLPTSSPTVESFRIAPGILTFGDNLVAVQLKQSSPTSGNATFGLRLTGVHSIGDPDFSYLPITQQPQSQVVTEGHDFSMHVEANNWDSVQYQWYHNGSPLPGETRFILRRVATAETAGTYFVRLTTFQAKSNSAPATVQVVPAVLRYDSSWKMQTNQNLPLTGVPWYAESFDDSSWPIAPGPFGVEQNALTLQRLPASLRTSLASPEFTNSLNTFYFRRRVQVPAAASGQTLVLCYTVDDGAAFYIDGELAHRYNLTNDLPILPTAGAAGSTPGGGDARIEYLPIQLDPGEHLIAVEVHQASFGVPDVVFGLELRYVTPSTLNIRRSPTGGSFHLDLPSDPSWDLMESANAIGVYVPRSERSPGSISLPLTSTNRFFRLRFNGR